VRSLSDTFAGIARANVGPFILAQFIGAMIAVASRIGFWPAKKYDLIYDERRDGFVGGGCLNSLSIFNFSAYSNISRYLLLEFDLSSRLPSSSSDPLPQLGLISLSRSYACKTAKIPSECFFHNCVGKIIFCCAVIRLG